MSPSSSLSAAAVARGSASAATSAMTTGASARLGAAVSLSLSFSAPCTRARPYRTFTRPFPQDLTSTAAAAAAAAPAARAFHSTARYANSSRADHLRMPPPSQSAPANSARTTPAVQPPTTAATHKPVVLRPTAFPTSIRLRGSRPTPALSAIPAPSTTSNSSFTKPKSTATPKPLPPPPTLVFSHHALGYAKRSPVRQTPVPTDHQWKATSAGEDAFFSRFNALGVCDGVGGWQGQENANAGLFARKLMHYCSAELDERPRATYLVNAALELDQGKTRGKGAAAGQDTNERFGVGGNTGGVFPQEVLERAYAKTMEDAQQEGFVGSTTALLALLTNGNELRIANLGDCGLVVIRQGEFVFRTEEQVHSFNYPYQLGTSAQDTPALAHAFALHAHHGDILVMASDGVWDNVFEEDVLRIVRQHVGWRGVEWPAGVDPRGSPPSWAGKWKGGDGKGGGMGGLGGAVVGAIEWMSKSVRAAVGVDTGDSGSSMDGPDPPSAGPAPSAPQSTPLSANTLSDALPPASDPLTVDEDDPDPSPLLLPAIHRARRAAIHAAARANPQAIAEAIAQKAKEAGEDTRGASPFQSRALREGLYYQGGKTDDIAVVVAVVRDPARLMKRATTAGQGKAREVAGSVSGVI